MANAFESFEKCLPRFDLYLAEYGSRPLTGSLKTGLVRYYTELIGLCQDLISILSNSAISINLSTYIR